ncbi:undecaprenyl-diphosphatase [Lachnospiraceae bacterium XBB1006]|nr:undecaprenyl-diphosphatase [Lachnospiraceae bacterium XBB1006]
MKQTRNYMAAFFLLIAFAALLLAVISFDVRPIGPEGSKVGLASVNELVRDLVGTNDMWYQITKYLGYLTLCIPLVFAGLGCKQLISRRSFAKVDGDLYLLAAFYVLVLGTYALFEKMIVNYRPVIMDEGLEASFPSSHTMLVIAVMGTAAYQVSRRVKQQTVRLLLEALCVLLLVVMVIGRMLSGVHWFTDIVAGVILADAYVMLYFAIAQSICTRKRD